MRTNEFGQAIGDALPDFTPGRLPAIERIEGRYTVIERLSKEKHGADLYQVYGPDSPAAMWTFLFKGPARNEEECRPSHYFGRLDTGSQSVGYLP